MTSGSRPRARLDRRAVVGLVVLFALALAVSRGCQQSQVRITQEQAIAAAERQVGFTPRRTQIRLIRQGLSGRPYWAVSLSVPGRGDAFLRLATVRVDANTGAVAEVHEQP
ncbi:MAG TPA: PepSY domain-containing protein [Solirubrobacteraceae bacterium]|nr:PepSY domain-containing protein [Solirubrobacteraceae bacterium]